LKFEQLNFPSKWGHLQILNGDSLAIYSSSYILLHVNNHSTLYNLSIQFV